MAIFQLLAARSPQSPPGRASRNKVLADSADHPDDAHKPDDLAESDRATSIRMAESRHGVQIHMHTCMQVCRCAYMFACTCVNICVH